MVVETTLSYAHLKSFESYEDLLKFSENTTKPDKYYFG